MNNVTQEQFDELKQNAIKIWKTYDDTYGYASEKISRLNQFDNIKDNYGTIIGMFDTRNQRKLYDSVDDDCKILIDDWVGGLEKNERMMKEMGL